MSLSQSSGSDSRKSMKRSIPALLTRMSVGPLFASNSATANLHAPWSEISHSTASPLPPDLSISARVARAASRFRSNAPMTTPASLRRRQMERPIEPPAPVTIATFPLSPRIARDRSRNAQTRPPDVEPPPPKSQLGALLARPQPQLSQSQLSQSQLSQSQLPQSQLPQSQLTGRPLGGCAHSGWSPSQPFSSESS